MSYFHNQSSQSTTVARTSDAPSSKRRVRNFLLAASAVALAGLLSTTPAQAATQFSTGTFTWDNGATAAWGPTSGPYTSTWTSGNDAVFEGGAGTVSVTTATAQSLTFNTTGYTVQSGTLTLSGTSKVTVGSGLTATINSPLAGTTGVQVEGGGTLNLGGVSTVDGGGNGSLGLVVGTATANNTVNLSSGGTMGTITANRRSLFIGDSTFGGNSVVISTAGSVGSPSFNVSGNGAQLHLGTSSSSNSLLVNNGAYVAQTNGGGTNTWTIGANAGANSNSMTITGTNSQVVLGSNQVLDVGKAGSSNTFTVSNGGLFRTARLGVGDGGGSSNSATIIGTGAANSATITCNGGSNGLFEIGSGTGANSNFVSVQAGGVINLTASGTSRNFSIGGKGTQNGMTGGGNSNYLEVTGVNSAFNMATGLPLALGGTVTSGTATDGGNNNHIDISSGGTMTLTNTSLYVLGSTSTGNTSVNLGNGTGISTLNVGQTAGYTAGVLLNNANGRLNFNSGRLIAGAGGTLVSGAGRVELNGAGHISTTFTTSAINSVIEGALGNSLIKEGPGTLTLSQINTYYGPTTIDAGTLNLTGSINNSSSINIATSAFLTAPAGGLFLSAGQQLTTNSTTPTAGTATLTGALTAINSNTINLQDAVFDTLNVTGTGALNGASLLFDLGNSSSNADQLQFNSAALSGTNTFYFDTAQGQNLSPGTQFTLISTAGLNSLTSTGTLVLGTTTLDGYTLSLSTGDHGVYLDVSTGVPTPTALLGGALLGAFIAVRRWRRA